MHGRELARAYLLDLLIPFRYIEVLRVLLDRPDPPLRLGGVRAEILPLTEIGRVVVHSEAFHALKEKGLHIEAVQVYNIYNGFDWLCQRERWHIPEGS